MSLILKEFNEVTFFKSNPLTEVDFSDINRVHDWRNYVPLSVQAEWLSLTYREKMMIGIMAEHQANREDWD